MRAKAVSKLVFILMFGFVLCTSLVSASTVSLWINTDKIAKTLIQPNVTSDNSDKYCQYRSENELVYQPSVNNFSSWIFKQRSAVQGCWYKTEYGLVGNSSQGVYLRLTTSDGPVARMENPNSHQLYAVGYSKKLIGIYSVGSQRNMYMYDDVTQAYELKSAGGYDKFVVKSGATKWSLTYPGTTQNLPVMRVGSSQNGDWVVVEATNGFIRINTDTKEILTFERALYPYGQGQDPTYDLAVSNDGRYIVISGGNVVDRTNLIYDVSTCLQNTAQTLQVATGCSKRNIKAEVFPDQPTQQSAQRAIFSDDSTNLTLDVMESGSWNRYVITAPGQDYHALSYLALGDSYASGEGDTYDGDIHFLPGTNGDGAKVASFMVPTDNYPYDQEVCRISTRSYPYLMSLAGNINQNTFKSVACSGSVLGDILNVTDSPKDYRYNGKYGQLEFIEDNQVVRNIKNTAITNFVPGRAAQIEFIKKYRPKVVTLGVGGNDIGFANKIASCAELLDCSEATNLRWVTGIEIRNMYQKLVDTYNELRSASPSTRYYVVGYPQIFSDQDDVCAPNVRFSQVERIYARELIAYLNQVISSAASTAGMHYIDVADSFKDDALCDMSFDGKAVHGLIAGDDIVIWQDPLGVKIISFGTGSYHPTNIGHQRIAMTILDYLHEEPITSYNPCAPSLALSCSKLGPVAPSVPPIPNYFLSYTAPSDDAYRVNIADNPQLIINGNPAFAAGSIIDVNNPDDANGKSPTALKQSSSVQATIYSTPHGLGDLQVDALGNISGQLHLPVDIAPGLHTITLTGKNTSYEVVTLYQMIYVYASEEDIDGDGVLNIDDQCQFVTPSGADVDRDGIDDACDGLISRAPDTTKPVVVAVVEGVNDTNVWLNHDATITWQVSDDSGETIAVPAAVTASQEGEHTYRSDQVCDSAGNCATGEVALKIDKTAPSVTPIIADGQPLDAWRNHETIITWDVMDNLDATITQPTDTTASMEGVHEYTSARICDHADNCANGTIVLKIDVTVPIVGDLSWSLNPKKTTETSQLSVPVSDTRSGIARAEYFIGDVDPGQGNGARMAIANGIAQVVHTTDFVTGVYKISVRTQDIAGNWSVPNIGYLVVYDPTSGIKVRGQKTIMIEPGYGVNLPWITQPTLARFGFSVRYDKDGAIAKQSDLQLSYKTGTNCNKPTAANCHTFDLNATSIKWLTTSSANNSLATFQAAATLKTDATIQSVTVIVEAVDGARIGETAADSFGLSIYQPFSTLFISPDMSLGPLPIQRGNIKIN